MLGEVTKKEKKTLKFFCNIKVFYSYSSKPTHPNTHTYTHTHRVYDEIHEKANNWINTLKIGNNERIF